MTTGSRRDCRVTATPRDRDAAQKCDRRTFVCLGAGGVACETGNRMSQLALFDSLDRVVTDDERGRITYEAAFVDAETAAAWFAEVRSGVDWRAERRQMYDREVDVPRLIGHYRLDSPRSGMPAAILAAAARVTSHLHVPFTSVGLNLYRDGRDSVAPRDARRAGERQPAGHGLRDAASLRPRCPENQGRCRRADQSRVIHDQQ